MTSLSRREFLQVVAVAAATGFTFDGRSSFGAEPASPLYDVPPFGKAHLLHFTDCHAQLMPVYFREPAFNIGVGVAENQPPHLIGDASGPLIVAVGGRGIAICLRQGGPGFRADGRGIVARKLMAGTRRHRGHP